MTTRTDNKNRIKVEKLDLVKETVKNLTSSESKKIKGGVGALAGDECPTLGRLSKTTGCCDKK